MAFRIFATVILLALGISIFLSHPEKYAPKNGDNKSSYMKYLGITFLLTFSNPLVIFIHLAIFSGFDQTLSLDKPQMSMLIM